jgi:hypothetical protein
MTSLPIIRSTARVSTTTILTLLASWGLEVRRLGRHGQPGELLTAQAPLPEREDPDAYFDVICTRPVHAASRATRVTPSSTC